MNVVKDDECPLCKSQVYLNPSMKMVQAICGHKFCETCINRSFLGNLQIQCPICKQTLKKGNFLVNKVDVDSDYETDMKVRATILTIFNKRREDFKDLKGYNDYLEEVEDIIYNLANEIDRTTTENKIKQYREEYRELIVLNASKKANEIRQLQNQLIVEDQENEDRKKNYLLEEHKKQKEKEKEREKLLEALATGKLDASALKRQQNSQKKPSVKPTPMELDLTTPPSNDQIAPTNPVYPSYIPSMPQLQLQLPQPKTIVVQDLEANNHIPPILTEELIRKQQAAAGWKDEYVVKRALEEAFSGLGLAKE